MSSSYAPTLTLTRSESGRRGSTELTVLDASKLKRIRSRMSVRGAGLLMQSKGGRGSEFGDMQVPSELHDGAGAEEGVVFE